MIDLIHFESFVISAENNSFSEAARLLHRSQPSVSHHIKALEEQFDVLLFDRSHQQLRLTDAGRLLLPLARKMLQQNDTICEMMDSYTEDVVGHLRIACSTTAGKYVLPLLAVRFRQYHPNTRISIFACTPAFVADQLLDDVVSLSVASHEVQQPGLQSQPFLEDAISLIVPANHQWAQRTAIEPHELLEERILLMGEDSGTRRVLLQELAKHDIGLDDLNILLEICNAEAIVHTVQSGYGVAFVSRLAASNGDLGRIAFVPVRGLDLRRNIYMIRRELHSVNRALDTFWGFVHDPANTDLRHLPENS
jgi:DNA-binding transcriptional LysR family regulator